MNPKIILLAQIAHEANLAYCRSIDDYSQPHWRDAPDWQKESAIQGVSGVLDGITPAQSHQNWMEHRAAEGWTYGEVKDVENKKHPCMVPYENLPAEQQLKDHLYGAVIKAAAEVLPEATPDGKK